MVGKRSSKKYLHCNNLIVILHFLLQVNSFGKQILTTICSEYFICFKTKEIYAHQIKYMFCIIGTYLHVLDARKWLWGGFGAGGLRCQLRLPDPYIRIANGPYCQIDFQNCFAFISILSYPDIKVLKAYHIASSLHSHCQPHWLSKPPKFVKYSFLLRVPDCWNIRHSKLSTRFHQNVDRITQPLGAFFFIT